MRLSRNQEEDIQVYVKALKSIPDSVLISFLKNNPTLSEKEESKILTNNLKFFTQNTIEYCKPFFPLLLHKVQIYKNSINKPRRALTPRDFRNRHFELLLNFFN